MRLEDVLEVLEARLDVAVEHPLERSAREPDGAPGVDGQLERDAAARGSRLDAGAFAESKKLRSPVDPDHLVGHVLDDLALDHDAPAEKLSRGESLRADATVAVVLQVDQAVLPHMLPVRLRQRVEHIAHRACDVHARADVDRPRPLPVSHLSSEASLYCPRGDRGGSALEASTDGHRESDP